jgi:hypothetical protein
MALDLSRMRAREAALVIFSFARTTGLITPRDNGDGAATALAEPDSTLSLS